MVINILEAAIKKILEDVTGLEVTPIFGVGLGPFVTYTHTPISGGVVKQSQIEVKIIDNDLDNAIFIRDSITKVLDFTDKMPSLTVNDIHIRSELAGGGSLFNDSIQMWELSLIFIMNWRRLNE